MGTRRHTSLTFRGEHSRLILNCEAGTWPPRPAGPGLRMKWQTRRLIDPQPLPGTFCGQRGWTWRKPGAMIFWSNPDADRDGSVLVPHAPWRVGDVLWVKEEWVPFKDSGRGRLLPGVARPRVAEARPPAAGDAAGGRGTLLFPRALANP